MGKNKVKPPLLIIQKTNDMRENLYDCRTEKVFLSKIIENKVKQKIASHKG
jgi:hypothetical protein